MFASKRQATENTRTPPEGAPAALSDALDTPAFRANLAAIEKSQPELAARLCGVTPPAGTRITTGRDGSPVAVLAEDAESVQWLGGSSMPTVSAPIAVEGHRAPFAGVVLLGIGTGYEPRYLAGRLARHYAVFVAEPDSVRLALGLAAADLSDLIQADRIVLLDGDVETSLADFLLRHNGFECPAQLYSIPGTDADAVAGWSTAVQRAATAVQLERAKRLEKLARGLSGRERGCDLASPRVLVMAPYADHDAESHVAAVSESLEQMGLAGQVAAARSPASCSTLARLEAVRDFDPDVLLLINSGPADLGGRLPESLPVVCWFLESRTLRAQALAGLEACPLLVAASARVRDELVARGARAETIRIIEPGLDERLFEDAAAKPMAGRSEEILLLADVEDLTPEVVGIRLQTQAKLWRRLVEAARSEIADFSDRRLDNLLKRAEREADVRLTDAEQRAQVRALAAALLPKTLWAVQSAKALLKAGLNVRVLGRNWASQGLADAVIGGPIPEGAARQQLFGGARCVVVPYVDGDGYRHALEAVAAGACPVLGVMEGEVRLEDRYPQTGEAISALPAYRTFGELASRCRKLATDPAARDASIAPVVSILRKDRKTTHQIQQLLNLVRGQAQ